MFHEMRTSGLETDSVTLSGALSACVNLGILGSGKCHEYFEHRGIEWDVHLGTAKIDVHAMCRCLGMAVLTFHKMPPCGMHCFLAR